MAAFADYCDYDGLGLAELVKKGEVSASELADAAIERAEKHNPTLNAIVAEDYDGARVTAANGLPDGPFQGVPFLVKDILSQTVKGLPCTNGTRYLKDFVAEEDGILVKRFRDAGVVILGKTNTPEFGITGTTESAHLGPCRSPWNPDHITGGSSGGSAGAVAAGIVPIAHASDGLGSIRIPAACCGLVGLKPTRDRNPHGNHDTERAIGFIADHIVSRSLRDTAAMLDATGYPEPNSPYAPAPKARPYMEELGANPGKLRIAFSDERPNGKGASPEVRAVLEATAKTLESLGHHVEEKPISLDWRRLYQAQGVVSSANLAAHIAELTERFGREPVEEDFEPLTWSGIKFGRKVTGDMVMGGWRTLRIMTRQILDFFDDIDVFITPTMITPPPKIGFIDPVGLPPREVSKRQAETFGYTPPQNFTGQPAMNLPLGESADGLPIGMQLVGRYGDEATLFRVGAQLEDAMPWRDRRPRIWN